MTVSVKTLNTLVKLIAHLELQCDLLEDIQDNVLVNKHKLKQCGNAYHKQILIEIERFWSGLTEENQLKFIAEVKGLKTIIDNLIVKVDGK